MVASATAAESAAIACAWLATSGEQAVVGCLALICVAHWFISCVYCSVDGGLKSIPKKVASSASSPEVASQAQAIAADSAAVADATKSDANPAGLDVVYWIAPENGAKTSSTPHVFHLCKGVSTLRDKVVNQGSVTSAYAENATRITKQIAMEQGQCGFGKAAAGAVKAAVAPMAPAS